MSHPTRRSLVLLPALLWRIPPAQADVALLRQVMEGLAAVPQRRAAFRERRRFAALTQTLESSGYLLYRRPSYLEKVTDWPLPERLVVDGDRLILTQAAEPPRVVDLGSQRELRTLVDAIRGPLSGDLAGLQRNFAIEAAGTIPAWTLQLSPLDPGAARLLRSIRIAGSGDELSDIATRQANGDEQWMQIGAAT